MDYARRVRVGIPVQQRIAGLVDGGRGGDRNADTHRCRRGRGRTAPGVFAGLGWCDGWVGLVAAAAAVLGDPHRGRVVMRSAGGNRRPFGGAGADGRVSGRSAPDQRVTCGLKWPRKWTLKRTTRTSGSSFPPSTKPP